MEDPLVVDFLVRKSEDLLSPVVYILSALVLLVIWIIGTVGNFLVLFLVYKNKEVGILESHLGIQFIDTKEAYMVN